jgi:Fic family protein
VIDKYQRAQERIREKFQVRTHYAKNIPEVKLGRPPGDNIKPYRLPEGTVKKMRELAKQRPPMTRLQIAAICKVSPPTVTKYLGVEFPNLGPRR